MRFLLDNDALDDEVSVDAHEHDAVVITHDRVFSRRRMDHTYGKHLWLRCEQPDAAGIVEALLGDPAEALGQHEALVVVASASGIQVHPPKWK